MTLEVVGLQASYGETQVLYGVSLAARRREITCVLGRNGVGKSTTLKSIIGLIRDRSGSIRHGGNELIAVPPHRISRSGIAYVPEERRIFPTLTVRENLLMGIRNAPAPSAKSSWTVERVLDYFPALRARIAAKGQTLSGGEQQMLAIGRALVSNPEFLLVDEPTEGLAPVIVEAVEKVVRDIADCGLGVLLVESKLAVAERLADRVYVMAKGRVAYEGSSAELRRDTDVRKKYLEV